MRRFIRSFSSNLTKKSGGQAGEGETLGSEWAF